MTNAEFYKTPKSLQVAYDNFCKGNYDEVTACKECPLSGQTPACEIFFALAEHAEPKQTKRRPYTKDEAVQLFGKIVFSQDGLRHDATRIEIVSWIDGGKTFINGRNQEDIMEQNGTIDGEPVGVEVTE